MGEKRAEPGGVLPSARTQGRHFLLVEAAIAGGGAPDAETAGAFHRRTSPSRAEAALNELVQAGVGYWTDPTPSSKGGQPTRVFTLSTGVYVYDTPAGGPKNGSNVDVDNVDGAEPDGVDEAQPDGEAGVDDPDQLPHKAQPEPAAKAPRPKPAPEADAPVEPPTIPAGWPRAAWRNRLEQLAAVCEGVRPDKPAEYRR